MAKSTSDGLARLRIPIMRAAQPNTEYVKSMIVI
jgi:hypothetical protein